MVMNIITSGYGNRQNIATQGYAGIFVIPGYIKKEKYITRIYKNFIFNYGIKVPVRKFNVENYDIYSPLMFIDKDRFVINVSVSKELEELLEFDVPIFKSLDKDVDVNVGIHPMFSEKKAEKVVSLMKLLDVLKQL